MRYPSFYDRVEPITLHDRLSEFLGTFEEGVITFGYLDVVKLAGHSCPTVAGAYLMIREGLKALYTEALPQRGEIEVSFQKSLESETTGVIAAIAAQITGATDNSGFKGMGGQFNRTHRMHFAQSIEATMRLTRNDTHAFVDTSHNPSFIAPDEKIAPLMTKILQGKANHHEKHLFGTLWQTRVEEILSYNKEVVTIKSGVHSR